MRIIGIDPGLRNTGWGIIEFKNSRLIHIDKDDTSIASLEYGTEFEGTLEVKIIGNKGKSSKIKKYTINLSSTELEETVECELIGGNKVNISRSMIITHLAMHGGYHRGIIAEMLGQTSLPPIAQDITVWEKNKLT